MLNKMSGKPFKCDQCNYASNRAFDLRRHSQRHTKVKAHEGTVYKCNECTFTTKWKRNMGRHFRTHRQITLAREEEEREEQEEEEALQEEEEMQEDEEQQAEESAIEEIFVEFIGAAASDSNEELEETPVQDNKMKFFVCRHCQYTSNRAFDLRRHEQTHSRVKVIEGIAYQCTKCSFITKWKRNVKRHVQKHAECHSTDNFDELSNDDLIVELQNKPEYGMEPSEVTTDSNTEPVYNTSENDERPLSPLIEIYRNGEKRFRCDQCHYETKRAFDLRRHKQRHTRVKTIDGSPVRCTECSFVTKWKRNMRRHMQTHRKRDPIPTEEEEVQTFDEFLEEVNSELESLDQKTEPYEVESVQIEFLDSIEEISEQDSQQLEILESTEDSEVLPSYWVALPKVTDSYDNT